MTKTHTIEVNDLNDWQQKEKVLFASSTYENKQLYATLRGSFEVWHNNVKIFETILPFFAVNRYNSIVS